MPAPPNPLELVPNKRNLVWLTEAIRPSPDDWRKPRPYDDTVPLRRSVFDWRVGENVVRGRTVDQVSDAAEMANVFHSEDIRLRFDAEQDRLIVATFPGVPVNRRSGATAPTLPLEPSITLSVRPGLVQAVWAYEGKLSGAQHAGIEERLNGWCPIGIISKGIADVWAPGFFSWEDNPERATLTTATGSMVSCGAEMVRYSIDHIDEAILAALRVPVRDSAWL